MLLFGLLLRSVASAHARQLIFSRSALVASVHDTPRLGECTRFAYVRCCSAMPHMTIGSCNESVVQIAMASMKIHDMFRRTQEALLCGVRNWNAADVEE